MVLLTFKRSCAALNIWLCLTAAFLIATATASPSDTVLDTAQKLAEREQPAADAAATSIASPIPAPEKTCGAGVYTVEHCDNEVVRKACPELCTAATANATPILTSTTPQNATGVFEGGPHFPVSGGGSYYSKPEPVALRTGQTSVRHLIGPTTLRNANMLIQGFLRAPGLWPKVENVTTKRPFIFFHQRKAGGSSIRKTLYNGARKKNLKTYIPCHGVKCDTYTLPTTLTAKNAAVIYGGHIPWGEPQNKYERFLHDEAGSREFSCATNFREPLSRVISCLHFRFPGPFKNKCITDMDNDLLLQYMKKPDKYGNSCLNEPFRIMSGIRTDVFADKLDVCTPHNRSQLMSGDLFGAHPEFVVALTLTLEHTMKCSPLILEAPESYTMAQQRFDDASGVRLVTDSGGMLHENNKNDGHTCGDAKEHPWQQKNLHLMFCVTAVEQMLYRAVVQKTECVAYGIPPDKCGQGIETTHISPFARATDAEDYSWGKGKE